MLIDKLYYSAKRLLCSHRDKVEFTKHSIKINAGMEKVVITEYYCPECGRKWNEYRK